MQACRPVADVYDTARRNLLDDLVKTDESGEYEKAEGGNLVFKAKDGRRKFDVAVNALLATKVTVNIPPLPILETQATDATPMTLFPLVPFCQV